jgi:hypothetical protein
MRQNLRCMAGLSVHCRQAGIGKNRAAAGARLLAACCPFRKENSLSEGCFAKYRRFRTYCRLCEIGPDFLIKHCNFNPNMKF